MLWQADFSTMINIYLLAFWADLLHGQCGNCHAIFFDLIPPAMFGQGGAGLRSGFGVDFFHRVKYLCPSGF